MSTTEQTQTEAPATETPAATTETPAQTAETPASGSTDLGSETQTQTTETSTSATDLGSEEEAAAADPFADLRGLPESGKYEAFTLPDGANVDEELQASFTDGIATELGLSQVGAQKLVDFYAKNVVQKQLQQWGDHLTGLKTDAVSTFGGDKNYQIELGFARAALKKFGGAELPKVMNQYGVGAHKEMIKAWAAVGRAISESPAIDNGGGSGVTTEKPLHELMYGAQGS